MHFASNVVRPPYEARSVYLQVTSGQPQRLPVLYLL